MNNQQFILSAAIFVLSVTGSQTIAQTSEQEDKILAVLEAENCQIVRDAMGEKTLSMDGDNFMAEAACADEKSYIFTLDPDFRVLDKRVAEN